MTAVTIELGRPKRLRDGMWRMDARVTFPDGTCLKVRAEAPQVTVAKTMARLQAMAAARLRGLSVPAMLDAVGAVHDHERSYSDRDLARMSRDMHRWRRGMRRHVKASDLALEQLQQLERTIESTRVR